MKNFDEIDHVALEVQRISDVVEWYTSQFEYGIYLYKRQSGQYHRDY